MNLMTAQFVLFPNQVSLDQEHIFFSTEEKTDLYPNVNIMNNLISKLLIKKEKELITILLSRYN